MRTNTGFGEFANAIDWPLASWVISRPQDGVRACSDLFGNTVEANNNAWPFTNTAYT